MPRDFKLQLKNYYQNEMQHVNKALTQNQREELVLKWRVEGLTTEEIASMLHIQPEMVELITEFAIEHYKPAWAN